MASEPSPSADHLIFHLDEARDHLRHALEADDDVKQLPPWARARLEAIEEEIAELLDRLERHDADLTRDRNRLERHDADLARDRNRDTPLDIGL
jgi:molecular chaperone GrpE (heat shock protein)